MKIFLIAMVIVVSGLLPCCTYSQGVSPAVELETRGARFVELLSLCRYSEAYEQFGPGMRSVMSEQRLSELWVALVSQLGQFRGIVATYLTRVTPYYAITVTTHFECSTINIRVVYDTDREVAGLWFLPLLIDQ